MWCELVTDFSRLEELSPAWQRWTRDNRDTSIFQRWEWARAFWNAYGKSVSLCSLALHDNGRIVGILPLVQRGETIEFLGTPESDYNDVVCEEGYAAPVLEVGLQFLLLQAPFRWRYAVLEKVPAHSRIVRCTPALSPKIRRHLQLVFRCPSPTVLIGDGRMQALNTLIDKEQFKRYHKKLLKRGSLAFRHVETREEAREHLDRFFHQHITRWAMNGVRSQFLQTECRAFYESLIREFDPTKHLRFGVLELDSQPIAYHFGFQHNGTLTWYKPAFDVNYWENCPGDVLLRSLLTYVRDTGVSEFDFTLGDEPFKYRFANHVRQNYILYVERQPSSIGSRCRAVVRRTEHIIRQKPEWKAALKNKFRRLQNFVVHFRRLASGEAIAETCLKSLRAVYRLIRSNDEVLFYASSERATTGASAVEIIPGTLDDIASLSVGCGYFLSAAKLHECRRRLKAGDRLFIARGRRGESFVIWLASRNDIVAREVAGDCRLPLAEPALVLDECWKAPEPAVRNVSSDVLRALAGHLDGSQLWIYDVRGRESLGEAIQGAGMELRHHLVRRTFFRWVHQTWEESPVELNEPNRSKSVEVVARASS
jgi:CelD/BcsL family acetyltransferase involved in cellulose biosynthesis